MPIVVYTLYMKKGIRQNRKCIKCSQLVVEYYYKGRFKGYRKTCEAHNGYLFRSGVFNSTWKGGKIVDKNGYIRVLVPELKHKRGASRYVLQHRLVVSEKVGRQLTSNEVVHHLNGIRDDNRPENLEIIEKSLDGKTNHETWTYSKALQKRIRDLELKLKEVTK